MRRAFATVAWRRCSRATATRAFGPPVRAAEPMRCRAPPLGLRTSPKGVQNPHMLLRPSVTIFMQRIMSIATILLFLAVGIGGGARAEDVRPATGTVCLFPTQGGAGCSTGKLTSPFTCGRDNEGRWECLVFFNLTITVFGPVTCGNATSTWTAGVSACAISGSAFAYDQPDPAVYHPDAGGSFVHGEMGVCVYLLGTERKTCGTWQHSFLLPGDPGADQAGAAIGEVLQGLLGRASAIAEYRQVRLNVGGGTGG